MNTSELSQKDVAALETEVKALQKATQQLSNLATLRTSRRAISRHVKRGGRIWIRVFPDKPISQKPAEVRMGNGKGNPEYYVAEIQPGKIVFEIVGVSEELAREAFRLAAAKLPLRTTFVARMIGQ